METKEKSALKHKTILIKRTLNLPVETVWKAWTEPETFKKWWGPYDYTCTVCTIDLEVGGKYLYNMKEKNGDEMFGTGTYKEIVPNKKLVMTDNFSDENGNITDAPKGMAGDWSKELLITVELQEKNGKTEFSLTHQGIPVEASDDCITGWNESIDKLEKQLAINN
jgi:uncharacterized protein YndB with AHSA1/START domain